MQFKSVAFILAPVASSPKCGSKVVCRLFLYLPPVPELIASRYSVPSVFRAPPSHLQMRLRVSNQPRFALFAFLGELKLNRDFFRNIYQAVLPFCWQNNSNSSSCKCQLGAQIFWKQKMLRHYAQRAKMINQSKHSLWKHSIKTCRFCFQFATLLSDSKDHTKKSRYNIRQLKYHSSSVASF